MYDPHGLLERVDQNVLPVLLIGGAAMLANYVLYIEAFRVGRRLRTVTMPMFPTMLWLVHDASFVAEYDKWFHGYNHWYVKLFWFALVVSVVIELGFIAQIIAYGRAEFAPFLTPPQWRNAVLALVGLTLGVWLVAKSALKDDLYVWTFGSLLIAYPIAGLTTMAKRRSVHGFTPLQPAALTGMCLGWFAVTIGWFGPNFRTWSWLLLAALATGSAILMTWIATRFRVPEPAAEAPRCSRTLQ